MGLTFEQLQEVPTNFASMPLNSKAYHVKQGCTHLLQSLQISCESCGELYPGLKLEKDSGGTTKVVADSDFEYSGESYMFHSDHFRSFATFGHALFIIAVDCPLWHLAQTSRPF